LFREHKSSETVRSYLLGTLEESSAALIEERYFADREFFLLVQALETALIEDYLADRLAAPTKRRFEDRYLSVPDLRRRLEEVRVLHTRHAQAGLPRRIGFLLVAATVLLCIGGATLWLFRGRMRTDLLPPSTTNTALLASLSLSPGISKGSPAPGAELALPSGRGAVRLVLELPGQRSQALCSAQVSSFSSDGSPTRVWSMPKPEWSTPFSGGQHLIVTFDSSVLRRGDYLVELLDTNGQVRESYTFRVSPM